MSAASGPVRDRHDDGSSGTRSRRWKGVQGRFERVAAGHGGVLGFAAASAFESLGLPLVIDLLAVPFVMGHPARRAMTIAMAGAVGSCLVAMALFLVGSMFGDLALEAVAASPLLASMLAAAGESLDGRGAVAIAVAAFLPLPYGWVGLAAGLAGVDPALFLVVSLGARGLRFGIVVGTARFVSTRLGRFWRRETMVSVSMAILLAGVLLSFVSLAVMANGGFSGRP